MFNNIGGKLKILAWIEFIGGMVLSVIAGIIYLVIASKIEASTYYQAYITTISAGIAFLIVGPIGSWIGSWATYALGEIIENSEIQKNYLAKIAKEIKDTAPASSSSVKATPPTTSNFYTRKNNSSMSTPQGLETISNSNEYVVEVAEAVSENNTIQCPACLKEVPATKHLCPHCGNSLK